MARPSPRRRGREALNEPSGSLGSIYHPAVVVVWRGEPGWAFRERRSANEAFFSGADDFFRSGERTTSISMEAGGVRLEIAHDSATGEVLVNGVPVQLPDGHNVVLVDDADAGGPPSDVQTLRVAGDDGEWIEVFLGRSEAVTEFVKCGTPLPEGTLEGDGRAQAVDPEDARRALRAADEKVSPDAGGRLAGPPARAGDVSCRCATIRSTADKILAISTHVRPSLRRFLRGAPPPDLAFPIDSRATRRPAVLKWRVHPAPYTSDDGYRPC